MARDQEVLAHDSPPVSGHHCLRFSFGIPPKLDLAARRCRRSFRSCWNSVHRQDLDNDPQHQPKRDREGNSGPGGTEGKCGVQCFQLTDRRRKLRRYLRCSTLFAQCRHLWAKFIKSSARARRSLRHFQAGCPSTPATGPPAYPPTTRRQGPAGGEAHHSHGRPDLQRFRGPDSGLLGGTIQPAAAADKFPGDDDADTCRFYVWNSLFPVLPISAGLRLQTLEGVRVHYLQSGSGSLPRWKRRRAEKPVLASRQIGRDNI